MPKNKLAKDIRAGRNKAFMAGLQSALDVMTVALNNKYGFGRKRFSVTCKKNDGGRGMREELKPWDLSAEGIENICKSLSNKLKIAAIHFKNGRKNTIINIDDYEHTILCWALSEYMSK